MAHPQQQRFIGLVDEFFLPRGKGDLKVLEIGSYDVAGSSRGVFSGAAYTGVDLCDGPGVDLVCSGHQVAFPDDTFDIALSTECFEHNQHWQATFRNMHRMTKPNGLVIVTCAGRGRLEHGTSRASPQCSPGTFSVGSDYYRNLRPRDFEALQLAPLFSCWHVCALGTDTYFVGWKGRRPANLVEFTRRLPSIRDRVLLPVRLFYLPVSIAAVLLPEDSFQNFALGYVRRTTAIRSVGRRLLVPPRKPTGRDSNGGRRP